MYSSQSASSRATRRCSAVAAILAFDRSDLSRVKDRFDEMFTIAAPSMALDSYATEPRSAVTLVTGLSGFYLLHGLDGWDRLGDPQQWWLYAMIGLWLIFSVLLFVLEPLFVHAWLTLIARWGTCRSQAFDISGTAGKSTSVSAT